MAIKDYFPRFWRAKAAVPTPFSGAVTPYAFLALGNREISPHESWNLYKQVSTLAIVVDLIADQVSAMETTLEVGGRPVQDRHKYDELLKRPGYNRDKRRLIKEICVQHLITGTAYVNLIGNIRTMPIGLDTYLSKDITHVDGHDGWAATLQLNEARRNINFHREDRHGNLHWLADDYNELICIYDIAGDVKGRGLSRLQAIRADVDLRLSSTQHNVNVMNRGATISGVLAYKDKLQPEQAEALKQEVRRSMTGSHNAGGVMITGGGEVDFKPISQTNKDMDWVNLVKVVNESIVSRYNVPNTIFNSDTQTFNNYSEGWIQFYQQAVLPNFKIIYGALDRAISERIGQEVVTRHDVQSVDVLAEQKIERAVKLQNAQLISPNEARQLVGYEPFLGGDQVLGPPGLSPIYEDYMTDLTDVQFTEVAGNSSEKGLEVDRGSKTGFRALTHEEN